MPSSPAKFFLIAAVFVFGAAPLAAGTGAVPVRIIVEAPDGQPVAGAYAALVPPERPWSRPVAEKTGSGATVMLEVPAGEYRVVAGAPGKGVRITDRLTVAASQKNELRVTLPAMRTLTGTVRDAEGRPLSDVTVGDVNAFVEAPLGRASELAARHLGGEWRTKTSADGSWSLRVGEGTSNTIVAEGAGYAPAWHPQKETATKPIDLVMRGGATLRLALDREAPEFVVTLTAKGDAPPVPRAWQAQFWARRVSKAAIEWPSLPAGEYDIYAQQRDPRAFGNAVKLGSVTIESGATRELTLQLPAARPAPKAVATVLVRPAARLDAATIAPFGRDGNGAPRAMPRNAEQVSGGTLLYLDTSGLTPPYFGTTSDRFVVLPAPADNSVATASVMDLGGGSLHLQARGDGLALPLAGTATFHGCANPETVAVPVAVGKGGRVTFAAPAGCSSFVLDFEPFSPIVLPKQLSLGDPEWLGEFTLYASGSAAVRVATDDGAAVQGAIVSVSAQTSEGLQASVPIAEKATGPDGWARFDRLPAGRELAVVARSIDGDRSAVEHVRAEPGQPRVVDPLRIPKPASLIVEPKLDPAFLEQFPEGHILTMFVEPLEGTAETRSEEAEDVEEVEFRRLLPGRWQLGAIITTGQGAQPVRGQQIEIKAGETKRVKALLEPLVFRGRVFGSSADLSGNIDILSSSRADMVPSVPLSPSGEFVAILPRRDMYFVGVRLRSTGQTIWAGNTPFVDPSLPVPVTLPQGVVVARLRANGEPVTGATVMARMQHAPTTDVPLISSPVQTGPNGEARIEGLMPGQWVVFLLDNGHAQKSVAVSNEEAVHADLDVTSGLPIAGTVMETFGAPVAGAKVTCLPTGPDGVPYIRIAYTQSDGSFDLGDRIPSRATVLCSVTSFSGAQGYRVVAGEHARLVLPADPASLRVTSLPPLDRFSSLWLVSRDGRVIEVSPYVARLPGSVPLAIPALAPEAWKLVRVASPSDWMALTTGAGALPGIVEVALKADERKTLAVDKAGRDIAPADHQEEK